MSVIKVQCIDQELMIVDNPVISSGDVNNDVVEFTFCPNWNGLTKTAVFYRSKEEAYYKLLDNENKCTIPREVLTSKGQLYFGVFGTGYDGHIITSIIKNYKIEEGTLTEGLQEPTEPTPELVDQFLAHIASVNESMGILVEKNEELTESVELVVADLGDKATKSIYGDNAISLGRKADTTVGDMSVAFGVNTTASNFFSHAEGASTTASGKNSHAEGSNTEASADSSHAEGVDTVASAQASHAEGHGTTASAPASHAEGFNTTAKDTNTHAEGNGTIARGNAQHVQGRYNVEDTTNQYAHIVGGGTNDTDRKNIHTLDWNGNAFFAGDVGTTDGNGNEISLKTIHEKVFKKVYLHNAEELLALLPTIGVCDYVMFVSEPEVTTILTNGDSSQLGSGTILKVTSLYYNFNFNGGTSRYAVRTDADLNIVHGTKFTGTSII